MPYIVTLLHPKGFIVSLNQDYISLHPGMAHAISGWAAGRGSKEPIKE